MLISAIVRYRFENCASTLLEVENPHEYVQLLATATLKTVISRYPYESRDGSACLKTEAEVISRELVTELQNRVAVSGAKILSLSLNEISYAPEISGAMLKVTYFPNRQSSFRNSFDRFLSFNVEATSRSNSRCSSSSGSGGD